MKYIYLLVCPILLLSGCKSTHYTPKRLKHLFTYAADDTKTIDNVSVSVKKFNAQDNEYYFGKRKLPFTPVQLTLDNQSDTDHRLQPESINLHLMDAKAIERALAHRSWFGLLGIALLPLALGTFWATPWVLSSTNMVTLSGFIWAGGYGTYILFPYVAPSTIGMGGAYAHKKMKEKAIIHDDIDYKNRHTLYLPAGQKISTLLFAQELKPRLIVTLEQAKQPDNKLTFELNLPFNQT